MNEGRIKIMHEEKYLKEKWRSKRFFWGGGLKKGGGQKI